MKFCMMSPTEQMREGEFQVVNHLLYNHPRRTAVSDGCLDPRLGVSDKISTCKTCGGDLDGCPGHWAYIKLELPVYNLGYIRQIVQVLQAICKHCGRLMLKESQRAPFLARMRSRSTDSLTRTRLLKEIIMQCHKNYASCPHCSQYNGVVRKLGPSKIIHEVYRSRSRGVSDVGRMLAQRCEEAFLYNKELRGCFERAVEDITPLRALQLFRAMTAEDIETLDMDPVAGPPERFVIEVVPVPPICIRPTVFNEGAQGSNEDDLTVKLAEVTHLNQEIGRALRMGNVAPGVLVEIWEFMQDQVGLYVNSSLPGLLQKSTGTVKCKPIRSLCTRLKGKHGRFRGNLCGKRVDFSARTVISPDPNLLIWEVGVPIDVAKIMTYPERVTEHNIAYLRHLVRNGPDLHPGANFVRQADGTKRFLRINRDRAAADLRVGDTVERHMRDGDIVLFNRQPSLHRISIMAHRARIMPFRTFRFNECVCTPYNADFDGDEMNLHLPQTEEARAEAAELMEVTKNLITPRTGDILVASTQDFLTTSFLLTRRDMFYDRYHAMKIASYCGEARDKIEMPFPAMLKPAVLWTGKQLWSLVLRPNRDTRVFLNHECKAKLMYTRDEYMCNKDGYVCFQNSQLMCGVLDKVVLGGGSKNCIWHVLMREYSPRVAALAMSRLAKLSARWIGEHGFSIGISDVTPSHDLTEKKKRIVQAGKDTCDDLIRQYRRGQLPSRPGMTMEQSLEASLLKELSEVRDTAGKMCMAELHYNNSPLIMALCGSKGSSTNISQMVSCVGQQALSGSRIPDGFIRRSLPHFPVDSKEPAAKGFVENSFYTGLNGPEFFFHTMAGREGLVDTAVKTAETGYMQRRLMKSMEDLHIQYDNSVRNSEGVIIQFQYGEDSLDPSCMEASDRPVNFASVLMTVCEQHPISFSSNDFSMMASMMVDDDDGNGNGGESNNEKHRNKRPLYPYEIKMELASAMETYRCASASTVFCADLEAFILGKHTDLAPGEKPVTGVVDRIVKLRAQYGLADATERAPAPADDAVVWQCVSSIAGLSQEQLWCFVESCFSKYQRAAAEPGTAVGALAAQSMGEPCTQMTLKTFHFAGVASMNVTLGVPRIKEIINATRNISTPVVTAELVNDNDETAARIVKGRIERTTLGEVCESMREVYQPDTCYIKIKLDVHTITSLQLDMNAHTVAAAIVANKDLKKLKIREKNVVVVDSLRIKVVPPMAQRALLFFTMQHLKVLLPHVVVAGIPGVNRAVINDKGDRKFNIMVEGQDLSLVMGTPGVVGERTDTNHIMVVEKVLGIEAARTVIMNEVVNVMTNHGMSIDARHTMLMADLMTFKGVVLGITRFGISKMRESVLVLASFERMTDFLFEAGAHSRVDNIRGVSECIICGVPVPLGTGLFKLVQQLPSNHDLEIGVRPTLLAPPVAV